MDKKLPKFLTISKALETFLLKHSTFKPYQKHNGKRYTIGYGKYLSLEEGELSFPEGLTEEEAYNLFSNEIILYENNVRNVVNVPLTQGQYDALVSLSYSINFLNPSTIDAANNEDWYSVAKTFFNYTTSNGVYIPKLFERRQQEVYIFQGSYQREILVSNAFDDTREAMKAHGIRIIRRTYSVLEFDLQKRQARGAYLRMTGKNLR